VERYSSEPGLLAVVVGGSVAHGLARPESDVDFMLVLEDGAAARRSTSVFADVDLADYDGGYADVKVVPRSFLDEVAEHGSEPARWAFEDAFTAWSRDDRIEAAIRAAAAYPEGEREQKLRDFVGHSIIAAWYLDEAARRDDPYLTQYASTHVVLYVGRAVLAHNRMLFPFHKWFLHELERAPERPPSFMDGVRALLRESATDAARGLVADVQDLTGVRPTIGEAAASFMRRTEWSWRAGGSAFEDS
jgi:hypothetical protein